ncbi:MAG: outer membrane protein assembly factor BamD, partial [Shinella sp.]
MVVAGSVGVKKTARIVYLTLFATASSVVLSACQSDPDIDISKLAGESEPADVLYNQGLANLNSGKVTEASRKFEA